MKKRLLFFIIAFCVSFASMVALSLYSMERFTTFTTYSDLVDQTHAVINELYKTEGCMKDLDRTERGYILTRDTIYTRYLNNAIDSVQPYIKHLETLLSNNKPAMAALTIIKADIALRVIYAGRISNMQIL
jgi:CHASE3 domain sensor protein